MATKTETVVTAGGIQIEQRAGMGGGVDRAETMTIGGMTFNVSRHSDGSTVVSIQKFGGVFAGFSLHLSPAQSEAFGNMLRRSAAPPELVVIARNCTCVDGPDAYACLRAQSGAVVVDPEDACGCASCHGDV